MSIDIKIVCKNEKYMPTYANDTDACMDLKIKGDRIIKPHSMIVAGTGLKVSVPNDHVMLIYPRSSTGIKLNCMLANTTGVIDAGYRGEIALALYNFGDDDIILSDGQRVAQFMIIPRPKLNLIQVADDDDFNNGNRGGGIGSTGKF